MNLVRNLSHKTGVEQDLDAEVRSYVDMLADEKARSGIGRERARREALMEIEGVEQVKQRVRDVRAGNLLEQSFHDLRYGFRTLARSKAFTITAALSLALGIGGSVAMFSLVDAVLLKPLPYQDPDRLVKVTGYYPKGAVAAFQELSRTLEVSGFTTDTEFNLTGHGEALRLSGSSVSANLFPVLGAHAEIGRTFAAGEDRAGSDRIAILSHSLWQSRFGGDPAVIGRMVAIDGVDRQIVGVMPRGFTFPSASVRLWLPLRLDPTHWEEQWGAGFMPLVGRLRPGASLAAAQNELRPLILRIITLFPYMMAPSWNADAAVLPLQRALAGDVRGRLLVLLGGAAFVLLIACSNVASLLVSRSVGRRKEIALRLSMGASRGRIVRQLLIESTTLGLVGGAIGLALAGTALDILKTALPPDTPQLMQAGLDWRVLAFAGGLSILTGIGFGLAPALTASRLDLAQSIRASGQRAAGVAGVRLRSFFVVGEVALSVVLVSGAVLLIESLWRLMNVDPGFHPHRVVATRVSPAESWCRERTACIAFYDELVRRAHGIRGVAEAALVNGVPLSGEMPELPAELEDHPAVPGQTLPPMFWAGAVTADYFRLMRIPILAGRDFKISDGEKSSRVVIVSAATARQHWSGQNPIGKHLRAVFEEQWRTVVGVAGDVRQYDLAGHAPNDIRGAVYMPYAQSVGNNRQLPAAMTLVLRTETEPSRVSGAVRELISNLSPNVPVSEARAMDSVVSASTSQSRAMMWLFVSFGGLALILAAIGTYGVTSYSTAQRTYEMGVRIALGATRAKVFGMVLRQSFVLVLAGLVLGLMGSIALGRALTGFLYGVSATDPATFGIVALLMAMVAVAAGYFPARKAAGVEPSIMLRTD